MQRTNNPVFYTNFLILLSLRFFLLLPVYNPLQRNGHIRTYIIVSLLYVLSLNEIYKTSSKVLLRMYMHTYNVIYT